MEGWEANGRMHQCISILNSQSGRRNTSFGPGTQLLSSSQNRDIQEAQLNQFTENIPASMLSSDPRSPHIQVKMDTILTEKMAYFLAVMQ